MNIKAYYMILLLGITSYTSLAQKRQNITINALGTTPLVGLKYDTRFFKEKQNGIGASIGFGLIDPIDDGSDHKASISIGPNYLIGEGSHQLLLGANAVLVFSREYPLESSPKNKTRIMFIPDIGYRFSPKSSGFTGQVTWNPLRSNLDKEKAYYYFGIGVGYSWK